MVKKGISATVVGVILLVIALAIIGMLILYTGQAGGNKMNLLFSKLESAKAGGPI